MIPKNITREDIIKALHKIKENGVPPARQSRDYYVVFENDLFPPKYVISVANEFANGKELNISKFITAEARRFLEKTGFKVIQGGESYEDIENEETSTEVRLSLERDLENYIIKNLDEIEEGLKIYSKGSVTGRQFSINNERIDILAIDKNNNYVVIELKVGTANYHVIGQILSYTSLVRRDIADKKEVRGIIIADDFDRKLRYAASEVPNISLKKYEIHFTFKDVK